MAFAPTDAETATEKIFLKNLHGSSAEFVVSSVFMHPSAAQLNHLVILNDAEEAAYFHNTLENLTNALDLFYFPSSFKNRKNFRLLNSSHVMLRTEMLTRLSAGGNRKIIVTYPEALFEKVVLPKTLSGNTITIKVNDTLNVDGMMELFVMYGFTRSDFVYEPGQFALRGGILDIYSFGNEKPYRVELFGNEVDSIRIFDPETQLSERKLLQVNIIPNIETQFESDEKISLLEFLPANTIVWMKDWDVIKEKIQEQEEDLGDAVSNRQPATVNESEDDDDKILRHVKTEDFTPAATIERQIQLRNIVEFGYRPHFSTFELEFHTKVQPAFNRQFNILINDLKMHEGAGYSIFIFAEQAKQLERLNSIFTDLGTEIQFTPIANSIHEGF
ncbi:MAG TPA: transcription-repair coupling factor, partial [Chitinophagaceae bacterium]|nr:transcription-repair coupling factor [Chitinophagaceae bacterium]